MTDTPKTVRMSTAREVEVNGDEGHAPIGSRKSSAHSLGGGSGGMRSKSKLLEGQREQPYEFVRMLYRGLDQGVTATSETTDQRVLRSKKCKTSGWQSRFAVPYRSLGTPDLYLPSKKGHPVSEDAGSREDRGATSSRGHGGMTAREMRQYELGVTPAGRPLNWLPEAERAMTFFGDAAKRNRRVHRSDLLKQLHASEKRVKCVRAGQMATRVLEQDKSGATRDGLASEGDGALPLLGGDEGSSTFLTGVPGLLTQAGAANPVALQVFVHAQTPQAQAVSSTREKRTPNP